MDEISQETITRNSPLLEPSTSFKGVVLAMIAGFGFAASNVVMKLTKSLSPGEHGLIRYLILFVCMLIVIRAKKLKIFGPPEHYKLLIVRSILGTVSVISFFFSITLISPADALTIVHSNILITALSARIFFKEKLMIAHIFAIVLTINGILFLSTPSYFSHKISLNNKNLLTTNNTTNSDLIENIKPFLGKLFKPKWKLNFIINLISLKGSFFAIISAFGTSATFFCLRKLSKNKIHWAVISIYVCWTAIPVSVMISILLARYKAWYIEINLTELPYDLFYAAVAGFLNLLAQVSLVKAFKYENPTKIAITKTTDVVFASFLQFLLLEIGMDILTLIGCLSILAATLIILCFELFDKNRSKNLTKENNLDKGITENLSEIKSFKTQNKNEELDEKKSLMFRLFCHRF